MTITDITGTSKLSNGVEMPYLGLGVHRIKDGEAVINAIHYALEAGYRHIDTAAIYQNEEGVGKAVNSSNIPREELFVVSKVWNTEHGYQKTINACEESLRKLGMDYLDLYLIHWPVTGMFKETWRALEHLYHSGKVRAIGVSNFLKHHLEDLLSDCETVPMVNQMEFHPRLVQQELLDFCAEKNIQYESWSPLMQGGILDIRELKQLAEKYGKTIVQVVLRWNLQKNVVTIPKSVHKERIISNADMFDFEIESEDMKVIDGLHTGDRTGPHPDEFV